jgi:hypothetical protein
LKDVLYAPTMRVNCALGSRRVANMAERSPGCWMSADGLRLLSRACLHAAWPLVAERVSGSASRVRIRPCC